MDAYDRYVIRRGDRMIVVRRRRPPPVTRNFDFDDEDHGYDRRYEASYLPDTRSPPRDLSDPDGGHESAVATEAAIQGLPEVTPPNKLLLPADQCAVCLMDFDAGDKLRAMPCAHAFHEQCIFRWLRRTAVCPLCRHPLPIQEEDE